MTTLEQAARQALEALSRSKLMDDNHFYCYAAATALRQALEQQDKSVYTEPQKSKWVGLSEEEISVIAKKLFGFTYDAGADRPFARAIEAKLRELNT